MSAAEGDGGHSGDMRRARPSGYVRSTATDRDEAEKVVTDLYLPHRLDLSGSSARLGMRLVGRRLGMLTVSRLTYGRSVLLRTADAENFHINIPLRGQVRSRSGNSETVTAAPWQGLVFSPGAPAEMEWSADSEQLCLMIPRAPLEAELEQLLGHPLKGRLSFDFGAGAGRPLGRRWHAVLDLITDELDHPSQMCQHPPVARHLESLVLDGLLLDRQHSHSDALTRDRSLPLAAATKRAVALLEERPAEPWTTVRLATEVHLSVRALQEAFCRDLAMPPMAYLRRIRLHRAREALQRADRDTTTVRTVALGLGILHMSRFAAAYREAFGESPSETLKRAV